MPYTLYTKFKSPTAEQQAIFDRFNVALTWFQGAFEFSVSGGSGTIFTANSASGEWVHAEGDEASFQAACDSDMAAVAAAVNARTDLDIVCIDIENKPYDRIVGIQSGSATTDVLGEWEIDRWVYILQSAKAAMPTKTIGFYGMPERSWWNAVGSEDAETLYWYARTDTLQKIWNASDALFPSIYCFYAAETDAHYVEYVGRNCYNALRVAAVAGNIPVIPVTTWYYIDTSDPVDEARHAVYVPAAWNATQSSYDGSSGFTGITALLMWTGTISDTNLENWTEWTYNNSPRASDMTESTLTVTYSTLRDHVTRALDYGYQWSDLTDADQQGTVVRCIDRGYRMFLAPTPLGDGSLHIWSFLRPLETIWTSAQYNTGTIEIASGVVTLTTGTFPSWADEGDLKVGNYTYEVSTRDSDTQVTLVDTSVTVASGTSYTLNRYNIQLPDNFGGIDGRITYQPDLNYPPLTLTSEAIIRSKRSYSTSTGVPTMAAIVPQESDQSAGHRFNLMLWPTPDTTYQLSFRKIVIPNALSASNVYPLGGGLHGETILAACMAVAEEFGETPATARRAYYAQRLAASVALDRQSIVPDSLGYNGDPSSARARWPYDGWEATPQILYNGSQVT